jgi:hypothetical protein
MKSNRSTYASWERVLTLRWAAGAFLWGACLVPSADGAIVINEIHYRPEVKTERAEFVELHNSGPGAVDLSGWSFTGAISFQVPDGTQLMEGGFLVVAEDPASLKSKYGATALGPWTGRLSSDGEKINLRNASGRIEDVVSYQAGFPWPVVGDAPGYSIELLHPGLDNALASSWRASVLVSSSVVTNPVVEPILLVPASSEWRFFRGTAEASQPVNAWRNPGFIDSAWESGQAPIGYGENFVRTFLGDMRNSYSGVFFRRAFTVPAITNIGSLVLDVQYDDGFSVWINGKFVVSRNLPGNELAYNGLASGARESAEYEPIVVLNAATYLVPGENIVAVQAFNSSVGQSSDFFLDLTLRGEPPGSGQSTEGRGPTPGLRNSVYTEDFPPFLLDVQHTPETPRSGETVLISATFADAQSVASAWLEYQVVEPGRYIELKDAEYRTNWNRLTLNDGAGDGDLVAGDGIFSATIPAAEQVHRRLLRYRLKAVSTNSVAMQVPYPEDPQPNFAYFVYDGVPAWSGAIRPGATPTQVYDSSVMRRLPVYHLISKRDSVEHATWIDRYGGDLYKWNGTLVYDGKVYDHIGYRARGGVWRYAMGKNMWKFDFLRGHDFEARDNYGEKYSVKWTKLNLGACIQQGDYQHRGEQGMFEAVGFRLFNLAGLEAPFTHWTQLRIVDDPVESDAQNQYEGDYWGLYLAIEQEDGRFLDGHDLPDGNLYKMEGGTGELNNQGNLAATDKSDLNQFMSDYRFSNATDIWWRTNMDLPRYYNYRSIVECIHHYDIDEGAGKNYFYYLNPDTGLWSTHPWDLDLTWANNMYGGGESPFKNRVLPRPAFGLEYRNRLREIRDLLFNPDQAGQLIDELASIIYDFSGNPSPASADRAMWDYNPVMISNYINPSKAGQGRFYQVVPSKDFPGMVQLMKNYVESRGAWIDNALVQDPLIPGQPTLLSTCPTNYPANRLTFRASAFVAHGAPFSAMKWRLAEVTPDTQPTFDPLHPRIYEITPVWESAELTTFSEDLTLPVGLVRVGHHYRVRVRMKDTAGRWSHWSGPVQFVAGEAENTDLLRSNIRLTEVMATPSDGAKWEFLELKNQSQEVTLDLGGVAFTEGIEFVFPAGTILEPGQRLLVVKTDAADNFAEFRSHYGLESSLLIVGPFQGSLDNNGEKVTLKSALAGEELVSFSYNQGSGWPAATDGAGHSLVVEDFAMEEPAVDGWLDYPGRWRASAYIGGSPGRPDEIPSVSLVINEVMAHTEFSDPAYPDYDSNDWLEIFNAGQSPVELGDTWFLSDDPSDLKKWRLPGATLNAVSWTSYDEVSDFHHPLTNGFGLSKAGETVLLSHLPGDGRDRVVDVVRFSGQDGDRSCGRYPDGQTWRLGMKPTRDKANTLPTGGVVFSEIAYFPGVVGTNEVLFEFIELVNAGSSSQSFGDTNGPWRLSGGVSYVFPKNAILAPREILLLVNFDPQNEVQWNAFQAFYGPVSDQVRIEGPFSGRLANEGDQITLEYPMAQDRPEDSAGWVVVDEVFYAQGNPWPANTNNSGQSLQRLSVSGAGSDPSSWRYVTATPGQFDIDWPLPHLVLSHTTVLSSDSVQFRVTAQNVARFTIEYSTDLRVWEEMSIQDYSGAAMDVSVTPPAGGKTWFYRLRAVQ